MKEHMPLEHRYYAEWNSARFMQWASKTGQATAQLVEKILTTRPYPEQGYRACLGIIRLENGTMNQHVSKLRQNELSSLIPALTGQ